MSLPNLSSYKIHFGKEKVHIQYGFTLSLSEMFLRKAIICSRRSVYFSFYYTTRKKIHIKSGFEPLVCSLQALRCSGAAERMKVLAGAFVHQCEHIRPIDAHVRQRVLPIRLRKRASAGEFSGFVLFFHFPC